VGNENKSDYPMKTCKLVKQTNKLSVFKVALLVATFFSFLTSSQAMDLSTKSDLVDSNLSASILDTASNISFISQIGSNNRAVVNQNGDNTAVVVELGNDNKVSINQDGVGNTALVSQFGNGNDIEINQVGSFNSAVTVQWGGAGYKLDQIGDNMSVVVTQFVQ
jgi:hypothetical protein